MKFPWRMSLLGVALLAHGALATSDLKITGYEIVADPAVVEAIKPLRPLLLANRGRSLSRDLMLSDVKRFQQLGTVGMVRVGAEPHKNGHRLLYRVEANPLVKEITFEGVTRADAKAMLQGFRTQPGQILDYTRLFADLNGVAGHYLKAHGLMYADVTDMRDVRVEAGRVVVRVHEFTLGNIVVKGLPAPLKGLVTSQIKLQRGQMVTRKVLLDGLMDVYQLSCVRDVNWYPVFDKKTDKVDLVLEVAPAATVHASAPGSRAD